MTISLAQDIENDECIFKEVLTKTFYDNYLSYKYSGKDLLLGLMRTGVAVAVPEVAAQQHHEYETRFVTKLSQWSIKVQVASGGSYTPTRQCGPD